MMFRMGGFVKPKSRPEDPNLTCSRKDLPFLGLLIVASICTSLKKRVGLSSFRGTPLEL